MDQDRQNMTPDRSENRIIIVHLFCEGEPNAVVWTNVNEQKLNGPAFFIADSVASRMRSFVWDTKCQGLNEIHALHELVEVIIIISSDLTSSIYNANIITQ